MSCLRCNDCIHNVHRIEFGWSCELRESVDENGHCDCFEKKNKEEEGEAK